MTYYVLSGTLNRAKLKLNSVNSFIVLTDLQQNCVLSERMVYILDSVLASWADAIDNTQEDVGDVNSALIDSDVSSEKASSDSSDPEAAFLANVDFASAVARAAELSGMTVVGSTVVDPSSHREKGAKRCSREL